MVNTFAIFTAGAAERPGAARHVVPATSLSLRAARDLGVAFLSGAPVRPSPVTALLPAGLRATFSLPTPAFYSP
jgi:hypothetical protein